MTSTELKHEGPGAINDNNYLSIEKDFVEVMKKDPN